jgi:hypothetical protein
MTASADDERFDPTWAGCAGRSQSVIKPDDKRLAGDGVRMHSWCFLMMVSQVVIVR